MGEPGGGPLGPDERVFPRAPVIAREAEMEREDRGLRVNVVVELMLERSSEGNMQLAAQAEGQGVISRFAKGRALEAEVAIGIDGKYALQPLPCVRSG